MLSRALEAEVMDTDQEADCYNGIDHGEVNRTFVDDFCAALGFPETESLDAVSPEMGTFDEAPILDVGAGTGLIPIELCGRSENLKVVAIDLSVSMLDVARYNIEVASLTERIFLDHIDAKQMPFGDALFSAVISNSIIHHIPEPMSVLRESLRVAQPDATLFFRDLARPEDDAAVDSLVRTYVGEEEEHARKMFDGSLRAALSLDEIRELICALGFERGSVQMTSDRHWTFCAQKPTDK